VSAPRAGRRTHRATRAAAVLLAFAAGLGGCSGGAAPRPVAETDVHAAAVPPEPPPAAEEPPVDARPPPPARAVPLWAHGRRVRDVDAAHAREHRQVVLDLGDDWTPYLFTERGGDGEPTVRNAYRRTYLALARGEFPDDIHGDRARADEYLELFGIAPTLSVLRERMKSAAGRACMRDLDLEPVRALGETVAYRGTDDARREARRFETAEREVQRLLERHHAATVAELPRARLTDREQASVAQYERLGPRVRAIRAVQARLECEGFLRPGRYTRGGLDAATHEALAKLEKRHRVFGWGFLGRDTLEVLRQPGLESMRGDVVRVLTERAMHAAGVIEDGSASTKPDGTPRTFRGRDGREHPIPDLESQLRAAVVSAFGLATPESTLAWLESLGDLSGPSPRLVAFEGPALPEYYSGDMDLEVEIDRGDVWYEFPYDDQGQERPQPVERRPRMTIFTTYLGQRIALARFGTTIGGWRSEFIDGRVWWKYKNSPPGPVVWTEIVAAPVWIPPESTPPRDLLKRNPHRRRAGEKPYVVNVHETGPSYASAYGLVAAYHRTYREGADGTIRPYGDEGIRSHGSVDYMSIMRRHSHGCHRLHNHIAVRLMSFVLAHRRHQRMGMQRVNVERDMEHEGETYKLEIKEGGYEFRLERPVRVNVLEGRVRGSVARPITFPIPRYDAALGGYAMPDGSGVLVRGDRLVPTTLTPPAQPVAAQPAAGAMPVSEASPTPDPAPQGLSGAPGGPAWGSAPPPGAGAGGADARGTSPPR
jgi:hypothetical protein